MKINTYTAKGVKEGQVDFKNEKVNLPLIAQAVRVYKESVHLGLAKVKTRAEVQISTRKIYKQKGTGGARHGAKSAPIFVGGGVAHGPKGIKRSLKLSNKLKKQALASALSLKASEGNLVAADLGFKKTKEAFQLIKMIFKDVDKNKTVSFILGLNANYKAFRNLKNVNVYRFSELNAYKVFLGGLIIFDKEILKDGGKEIKKVSNKPENKNKRTSNKEDKKEVKTRMISTKSKTKTNTKSKTKKD